jgi:CheY-like chemotaxis protein
VETIGHIPIIALTAHAWVRDRDKASEAGCDEYETNANRYLHCI